METLLLILPLLIALGMIALKYFAKRLTEGITGYITEKGKNLATIEDIRKITEEVESVKSEFSTQLELLKAELFADIQQQLSIFAKRNEALSQFFEDSFTVWALLSSGNRYHHEDIDGLDRLIKETQERIIRAIASYHRLTLYVQEEGILTPALIARKALAALLETWWGLAHKFRDALADEAREWKLAEETGDRSYFEQSQNDRPAGQAFSELRLGTDSILKSLDGSLKEYGNALNTHFHSVDRSKALAATTGMSPLA
jgi:hypothetical protein